MLLTEELTCQPWRFALTGKPPVPEQMFFDPDGKIRGYVTPAETFWSLSDVGTLCLYTSDRRLSATFEESFRINQKIALTGFHILDGRKIGMTLENVVKGMDGKLPWTYVGLQAQARKYGWKIGDFSYGVPRIHDASLAKLEIGRFTSIAPGVEIALGNHRMDLFTTYPFATLGWPGAPRVKDHRSGDVVIGSDVWIGASAFIASGVTIGHGAVVGAHAVVTKDVPPYAIVGGSPARIIRYRFDQATIDRLLAAAWWEGTFEEVNENLAWIMEDVLEVEP